MFTRYARPADEGNIEGEQRVALTGPADRSFDRGLTVTDGQ
ncbi:hypothetical protein BTZ20_3543 [Rhodococcus sp. MTM3W5.2]|nr:hypothetical protein [Rhodococcus sp. MTM3W5.2]AQA20729.1 hypothetical protein BTZ20_3543 [Rhodococcus sp. MTM3W5.2]